MTPYNILIVEDEPSISESLSEMLQILDQKVVGIADSYDAALKLLDKNDVELALLDIQLKGDKSGIDLADTIRERYRLPFIFTTAFADSDTIRAATEQGPYGYLVKPYSMKNINAAIEVAMQNHRQFKRWEDEEGDLVYKDILFVKANGRLVRIDVNDLMYVEAKGDYALFKTDKKGYIVNSTFKNIESKLNPNQFIRVHRSYIINIKKVVDIEENNLLIGEQVIPVSRSQKPNLMNRLNTI